LTLIYFDEQREGIFGQKNTFFLIFFSCFDMLELMLKFGKNKIKLFKEKCLIIAK
jgi:hypothetical protein